MKSRTKAAPGRRVAILAAALLTAVGVVLSVRAADFQIVWVVIGEAATSAGDQPVRAGRHLFMAPELADLSLKRVNVARVEAEPTVTNLAVGERFCLTSLKIIASGGDGSVVKHAPLSVSVRQDHRDALGLQRRKDDICVQAASAGEYPIRFTSLLPALDGTARGAQIFLRVRDLSAEPPAAEPPAAEPRADTSSAGTSSQGFIARPWRG